jgi:subtilisin family serine protease
MGTSATIRCAAVGAVLATAVAASGAPAWGTTAGQHQVPGAGGGASGYIVTLEAGTGDVVATAEQQLDQLGLDGAPDQVYRSALKGYTAELTSAQATSLAAMPGVKAVEPDGLVWLTDTQPNPPWGVDRIDQADLPLSASYTYTATGAGVTAYVIDSGVRATHADFGGRATTGVDLVDGGAADDCLGHGTHVSSTIGGATYGVAKGVSIKAVRVFGCESTAPESTVIAGVDWVVANHQAGQPAVANMSLSYLTSAALDSAVQRLVDDGVTVAVAAGNGFLGLFPLNACDWSPGRLPAAITVAASDVNDQLASFSNRGNCVDIIGPGVDVPGATHNADTGSVNMSGTSMATPHVVGAAAKVLQLNPGATPDAVATALEQQASVGTIDGTGPCIFVVFCLFPETPNLLVRSNL